jgi:hypothetical protein
VAVRGRFIVALFGRFGVVLVPFWCPFGDFGDGMCHFW